MHHIAWRAESRKDVDKLHELLVDLQVPILDAPAEYPDRAPWRGVGAFVS
jgi:glyoxylase I family protein